MINTEQKLYDTREDVIRLEGKIDLLLEKYDDTARDIAEIKARCKDEDKRVCKLEDKVRDSEVSWKTLVKIGVTSAGVITIGIAIFDVVGRAIWGW